ncbi:hypothetical protein ACQ4PT_024667 [Festuca glaucescens]
MSARTLRWTMPRTLALTAVQRQTAASRSTNPFSSGQHSSYVGTPTLRPSSPPSTLAHTLSLRVSMGHCPPPWPCPPPPWYGGGTTTGGVGTTTGGWQYGPQPCTATTERTLRAMKSATLDSIVIVCI